MALFKRWIEALVSGDFGTCRGVMYDGEGCCPFGVYEKAVLNEVFSYGASEDCLQGVGWRDSQDRITEPTLVRLAELRMLGVVTEADVCLMSDYHKLDRGFALLNRADLITIMADAGVSHEAIAEFLGYCGWDAA